MALVDMSGQAVVMLIGQVENNYSHLVKEAQCSMHSASVEVPV